MIIKSLILSLALLALLAVSCGKQPDGWRLDTVWVGDTTINF